MSRVIDRLFLYVFSVVCFTGGCVIILHAPMLYDYRAPILSWGGFQPKCNTTNIEFPALNENFFWRKTRWHTFNWNAPNSHSIKPPGVVVNSPSTMARLVVCDEDVWPSKITIGQTKRFFPRWGWMSENVVLILFCVNLPVVFVVSHQSPPALLFRFELTTTPVALTPEAAIGSIRCLPVVRGLFHKRYIVV